MKTVLLSILLVLAAVVLLGVKVLFVKGSTFPSGHAHSSPALRSKGIGCAHGGEEPVRKPVTPTSAHSRNSEKTQTKTNTNPN